MTQATEIKAPQTVLSVRSPGTFKGMFYIRPSNKESGETKNFPDLIFGYVAKDFSGLTVIICK